MANITLTNQTNSPVQIDTTLFGVGVPTSADLVGTDLQIAEIYAEAGLGVVRPGLLPVNSVAPAVTGTVEEGQVLTTTNGTWSNSPTFTRKWQRGNSASGPWVDIASATATTYTLETGDLAKYIRSAVTATTSGGSSTVFSNVVGPVVAEQQDL